MTQQNYTNSIEKYNFTKGVAVAAVAVILACTMYQCSKNLGAPQNNSGLETKIQGDKK